MNGVVIGKYAEVILIVTGALTFTSIVLVVAPVSGIRLVFGSQAEDPFTVTIVRYCGLLVALVGALLVWAGFDPALRVPVMAAAIIEKAVGGIFFMTALPRKRSITSIVAADSTMALLYILLLTGTPQ